ncbi:hypothetical protein CPC08DRAFT_703522 [Agrocybe pediades]|nr:hypothetical protein CPC08DRAFT_703522 [Agrocybe pediades]
MQPIPSACSNICMLSSLLGFGGVVLLILEGDWAGFMKVERRSRVLDLLSQGTSLKLDSGAE